MVWRVRWVQGKRILLIIWVRGDGGHGGRDGHVCKVHGRMVRGRLDIGESNRS